VYHLLHVNHVSVEVRLKVSVSVSDCLLPYFINFLLHPKGLHCGCGPWHDCGGAAPFSLRAGSTGVSGPWVMYEGIVRTRLNFWHQIKVGGFTLRPV